MSDSNDVSRTDNSAPAEAATAAPARKSMPTWFIAGILGVFIGGGGGMLLAMYGYDYRMKKIKTPDAAQLDMTAAGMSAPGPGSEPPGPGMPPPPGMGMGGPGMGMGGPGMGGGGGPSGKRDLTTFIGKVELLSRPNVQLQLDAEQQAKLAAELEGLEKAEKMTDDDAEKRLEAFEALLTPEQKDALDAVALPRRGRGGPPGGGPGGAGSGGAGPGGESPDDNPFAQETNQKRLHDLLSRLQSAE